MTQPSTCRMRGAPPSHRGALSVASANLGRSRHSIGVLENGDSMSVEITHIRLSGGNGHEHIVSYRWRNPSDGNSGTTDKPAMVAWVDEPANRAFVGSGAGRSEVGVVRPQFAQAYLRTYADGQWNNNLLALPHF